MRIFKNRLREFVLTRRYPAETVDLSHLGHCVLKMTINVCKIKNEMPDAFPGLSG